MRPIVMAVSQMVADIAAGDERAAAESADATHLDPAFGRFVVKIAP